MALDYVEPHLGSKWLDDKMDAYLEVTAKRPCKVLGIVGGITILLSIVPIMTGAMVPSTTANADWFITDNPSVQRMDMLDSAHTQVEEIGSGTSERSEAADYMFFFYESKAKTSIFTAANVQQMCNTELVFFQNSKYTDFCQLSDGTCLQPTLSIPYMFYQDSGYDFPNIDTCPLLDETAVTALGTTLVNHMNNSLGQQYYGFYMAKNTVAQGYSIRTRSGVPFGGPLDTYDTLSIIGDAQSDEYQDLFVPVTEDLWDMYDMEVGPMGETPFLMPATTPGMEVRWFSWNMWNWESLMIFETDSGVIMITILFVYFWLWVHIRSWLLATFGIGQIFLSLVVGCFIYYYILQVRYFATMQTLAIFIILGIGADDVFVLADAWKQSAADVPRYATDEDETVWFKRRLRYSYVRTAEAVLNTSFTTFAAFLATSISPVLPIFTFGVYSAVCVAVNYIFVITLTPPILVIDELRIRRYPPDKREKTCVFSCCGCCGCSPCCGSCCAWTDGGEKDSADGGKASSPDDPGAIEIEVTAATKANEAKKHSLYVRIIETPGVAVALTIVLGLFAVLMAWRASLLVAPVEQEKWLPQTHMFSQSQDLAQEGFLSGNSDDYAELTIAWGMKDIVRTKFDQYIPGENRGKVKFDGAFDLFDADSQAAVLDACARLEDWTCNEDGCQFGKLVRAGEVRCFLSEFNAWHLNEYGTAAADVADSATYVARLTTFRENDTPDNFPLLTWEKDIGIINGELKYVQIGAKMTMKLLQAVRIKDPIEARAEAFVKSIDTPKTAKTVFQYSFDWTWSATQTGMISGMTTGMSIAFPLALVVLTVATMNWLIALLAIISVGSIVAAVLGVCECFLGWSLGTGEAIAGVMVIGLAVDYTIHLGHMYADADHVMGFTTRRERFEFSAEKMVGTVVAGGVTTGGGGFWMFLCTSSFFPKMATLICGTVFFSLIYSLFWFMPVLYLLGPENDFAQLKKKQAHATAAMEDKAPAAAKSTELTVVSGTTGPGMEA